MAWFFFQPAAILLRAAGQRVRVRLTESFSMSTRAQWISGYKTQLFWLEQVGGGGETPGMFLEEPWATDHRRPPSSESTFLKTRFVTADVQWLIQQLTEALEFISNPQTQMWRWSLQAVVAHCNFSFKVPFTKWSWSDTGDSFHKCEINIFLGVWKISTKHNLKKNLNAVYIFMIL